MSYYVKMSSGELYHYGILGMKLGQRNGPPYPLGASDHSAREKATGYTKSIKKARSEYTKGRNERYKQYKNTRSELLKERKANAKALKENRNKYENDHSAKEKYKSDLKKVASDVKNDVKENVKSIDKDKVLKAAKIGAAVAVAGLAAYGGYKLYKSGQLAKGRAAERKAFQYARTGINIIPNPRPGREYIRDKARDKFDAVSKYNETTYRRVSEAIDKGETSALKILDNLGPKASYNSYSLKRQTNEGFFPYRTNGQDFIEEQDPLYQFLKDLYL